MAKSKYQVELEEFKKNLPSVILKHAERNGLDLCRPGLQGLFEELDVPWELPRERCVISISFSVDLPINEGPYGPEIDDEGDIEARKIVHEIESNLSNISEYYKSGTLEFDEVFIY